MMMTYSGFLTVLNLLRCLQIWLICDARLLVSLYFLYKKNIIFLLTFKHASEELRGSPSGASVPSAGSSSPVFSGDLSRVHSRSHSQGGMSSMSSSFMSSGQDDQYQQGFKSVKDFHNYNHEDESSHILANNILAENNLLKSEIRCLNNELALLLQRSKAAEKGLNFIYLPHILKCVLSIWFSGNIRAYLLFHWIRLTRWFNW